MKHGAAADQGTADDGTRPEGAHGPPIADREPLHGGADDGGAAAVGQVVVRGGGDEGADDGDAERLADVVERARRTRVARIDTLLPGYPPVRRRTQITVVPPSTTSSMPLT